MWCLQGRVEASGLRLGVGVLGFRVRVLGLGLRV